MFLLGVLLTVLFVALKLTHVIAWSWFLVISPMLAVIAIGILFLILGAILGALVSSLD